MAQHGYYQRLCNKNFPAAPSATITAGAAVAAISTAVYLTPSLNSNMCIVNVKG
jgi:hypothetical protein